MAIFAELPTELQMEILSLVLSETGWEQQYDFSKVCPLWSSIVPHIRSRLPFLYEPAEAKIVYSLNVSGEDYGDIVIRIRSPNMVISPIASPPSLQQHLQQQHNISRERNIGLDGTPRMNMHKFLVGMNHRVRYPLNSWNPRRLQGVDSVEAVKFFYQRYDVPPSVEVYGEQPRPPTPGGTTTEEVEDRWRTKAEHAFSTYAGDPICQPPVKASDVSVTCDFLAKDLSCSSPWDDASSVTFGFGEFTDNKSGDVTVGDIFDMINFIMRRNEQPTEELRNKCRMIRERLKITEGLEYFGKSKKEKLFQED